MELEILSNYWGRKREEILRFPLHWTVELCQIEGAKKPALKTSAIRKAINNPVGTPRLREIAQGKRNAAIVFDDISRPTRVKEIAPFIIKELIDGGIKKKDISFICSLGAHGVHTAVEFNKKLGKRIVEEFKVYNHNPFMNCEYLGETSLGTKVEINKELVKADIKIGIGSMVPHPIVCFSGGGKVFFPGMASMESIKDNHLAITKHAAKEVVFWQVENNVFRNDIDEAVGLINVDFTVTALLNGRGETIALFAGDYRVYDNNAITVAKRIYNTKRIEKKDIIILNTFLKPSEAFASILLGTLNLKESGGVLIVIMKSSAGQIVHYLTGSFGKYNKGPLYFKQKSPKKLKKIILVSQNKVRSDEDWFPEPEKGIVWKNDFSLAIKEAEKMFSRKNVDAAIFPNATIQYYPNVKVSF